MAKRTRLLTKRLACGHIETRTPLEWSIREGLAEKCDECVQKEIIEKMGGGAPKAEEDNET